jgi:transposase
MQISTIGIDLAKNVFQVHAVDAAEKLVLKKQLRRSQVLGFFSKLSPCLVGMEACATSHPVGSRAQEAWPRCATYARKLREGTRPQAESQKILDPLAPSTHDPICDISAQFLL